MNIRRFLIGLFLLGAAIRAIDVGRNVDGSVRDSWRECDVAAIARNYYREGMNLFYARIDWRGTGPGYVEMEFPLYPWLIACGYKVFGFHEVVGRSISYIFSLLTLLFFIKLSALLLPPLGAVTAVTFFALSPMLVKMANALQPEGLMFLCYVIACYAFMRWVNNGSWPYYALALASISLSILAKLPAAHILLFFLLVIISRRGLKTLKAFWVWLFFVFPVLPAALWYLHAHRFWLIYGNSLGVTNQHHWPDAALLSDPNTYLGILRIEFWNVWMPTGAVLALYGMFNRKIENTWRMIILWVPTVVILYLAIANTASKGWAYYYHIFSILPASIILGLSIEHTARFAKLKNLARLNVMISILLGALIILAPALGLRPQVGNAQFALGALVFWALITWLVFFRRRENSSGYSLFRKWPKSANAVAAFLLMVCLPCTFLFQSFLIMKEVRPRDYQILYECAVSFAPYVPEGSLILVSGGNCRSGGRPAAYNTPYFFYWLDRKGFSICGEDHTIDNLVSFSNRGIRFFIAERSKFIRFAPDFESELRKKFKVISECREALLLDITAEKPT